MEVNFAEKVLQFRANNRMTQVDLAKMAGVSVGCIYRLETGQGIFKTTKAKVDLAMKQYEQSKGDN